MADGMDFHCQVVVACVTRCALPIGGQQHRDAWALDVAEAAAAAVVAVAVASFIVGIEAIVANNIAAVAVAVLVTDVVAAAAADPLDAAIDASATERGRNCNLHRN